MDLTRLGINKVLADRDARWAGSASSEATPRDIGESTEQ